MKELFSNIYASYYCNLLSITSIALFHVCGLWKMDHSPLIIYLFFCLAAMFVSHLKALERQRNCCASQNLCVLPPPPLALCDSVCYSGNTHFHAAVVMDTLSFPDNFTELILECEVFDCTSQTDLSPTQWATPCPFQQRTDLNHAWAVSLSLWFLSLTLFLFLLTPIFFNILYFKLTNSLLPLSVMILKIEFSLLKIQCFLPQSQKSFLSTWYHHTK